MFSVLNITKMSTDRNKIHLFLKSYFKHFFCRKENSIIINHFIEQFDTLSSPDSNPVFKLVSVAEKSSKHWCKKTTTSTPLLSETGIDCWEELWKKASQINSFI